MNLNIDRSLFYTRGGLLDKILDSSFDRALIIDKEKRIIFFSASSSSYSGMDADFAVGKPLDEIVKNHTGFDNVLMTGESDKGILEILDGELALASHIPVFDGDELLGAIGLVYYSNLITLKKILTNPPPDGQDEHQEIYHQIARQVSSYTFKDYVGEHELIHELIEKSKRAAVSNLPILFIGETGTGKEILANAVHHHNRNTLSNPFVKINCSAIPSDLLEAELFGYDKGAFTGATASKKGKFELASNGSLLLDEIGEMPYSMQAKLLRVLEEREFERVGGNKLIPTNTRIIASTNADLYAMSQQKRFREDLYYRLNALEIHVPPLRAHRSDIPKLIRHFINRNGYGMRFSEDAVQLMTAYSWPGNVRQLRNVINHFGVLNNGDIISSFEVEKTLSKQAQTLEKLVATHSAQAQGEFTLQGLTLEQLELKAIEGALSLADGNRSVAASKLGISRSTLLRKIKFYGITL